MLPVDFLGRNMFIREHIHRHCDYIKETFLNNESPNVPDLRQKIQTKNHFKYHHS